MTRGRWTAWTTTQERVLAENAALGAKGVVEALKAETGVERTEQAVRMHAYRMGISVISRAACPRCGRTFRAEFMAKDGLCRACHWAALAEEYRCGTEEVRASLSSPDDEEERREYDRVRQAASTARRKMKRGL